MQFFHILRPLAIVATALSFTSCAGYRLGADKPAEMADVQTLAVPNFRNDTLEPRCSAIVTNNVIKQFQMDGTYKLASVETADAVLRGKIDKIERRQLRGAKNNTLKTRELELKIWISYTVESRTGTKLMDGKAQGTTSVFLDPNFQLSERQAIDDAAARAAEQIFSEVTEGW